MQLIIDYYEILEVQRDAPQQKIRASYRQLARDLHPDTGGDKAKMQLVNRAYEILGDINKRREYDRACEQHQAEVERQRLAAQEALERELEAIEKRRAEDAARAEQAEVDRQRQASDSRPSFQSRQSNLSEEAKEVNSLFGLAIVAAIPIIVAVLIVLSVILPIILRVADVLRDFASGF